MRNRPRAHGEDVAHDTADSGRGALVRLDRRGMVVRLDLEDRDETVTDVDGAGVLARPLSDTRPFRREQAQERARVLVAAVLAPHRAKHAEFDGIWRASKLLDNQSILVFGERDFGQYLGRYVYQRV